MVSNAQLNEISNLISLEYYILSAILILSSLSALYVDGSTVPTAPFFEPRENNVSFPAGSTATLLCSVTGLQTRFVVWRRMSEPNPLTIGDFVYSPDGRISIRRVADKNEWNLVIKDVNVNDAGVYECAVSSRKKYKRLVLLRVNGTAGKKPRRGKYEQEFGVIKSQVVISGKSFVSKGQSILLMCNATGEDYAPDGVDWFINGLKVSRRTMPRVRIYDKPEEQTLYSTLEIKRSEMTDKGMYVCRGPDSKTASLTIHILDEEKSSIDKRGFENNSAIPFCSFQWSKQCCLFLICLSATWFTHAWFVT